VTEMAAQVRERMNELAAQSRFGFGRELAEMVGVSESTVSRFRNAIYTGDNEAIAAKLGEALASIEAARAIAGGQWRAAWLVKRGWNVRVIRKWETVEAITSQDPEAHVVQVWIGPGREDLHFAR
jgi:hypothetical protein